MLKLCTFFLGAAAAYAAPDITIAGDGGWSLKWQRNISVMKPGFLFLPEQIPDTLLINSFEATPFFGKDGVYRADVSQAAPNVTQLTSAIDWPNEITVVPESVFGFQALIIGAGFLVPSHSTGGLWIMESSAEPKRLPKPVKVSKDEDGYFYHRGVLRDMNGDGLPDIVTSRCHYQVWPWSTKSGELVWYEQPKTGALEGKAPWTMHKLHDGPDFLFTPHPDPTKGFLVAAAEYVAKKVAVYSMDSNATGAAVHERVVDADSGPGFSVSWADLNGDGHLDLLATNHLNQDGSVFGYSWGAGDIRDPSVKVEKHVLATGFSAISTSQGTAAPGDALAFWPKTELKGKGKPWVFVSGDNGNTIVLLRPDSDDAGNWTYKKQILAYIGADVGQNVIGDTDGNGFMDLYVPAYDNNEIMHYEFRND